MRRHAPIIIVLAAALVGGVAQAAAPPGETFAAGCRDGDAAACHELAHLYSQGLLLPRDSERAARLYAHGCDLGYNASCAALGVLYVDGRGVERSGEHALWLLNRACAAGYAPGCRALGEVLDNGYADVPRLPASARGAWDAGCALEDPASCAARERLGPGPTAPPLPGTEPPPLPLGNAASAPEAPDPRPRDADGEVVLPPVAMSWSGYELAVSYRDPSVSRRGDVGGDRDLRAAWGGSEIGALVTMRTGIGGRLALSAAFDLGALDDDHDDASLGRQHLELDLEILGSVAVGRLSIALGAGWQGIAGPITENSSLALSAYLIGAPYSGRDGAWFLRVTPVQLLASNERELLSPLAVELRYLFAGGLYLGVEGQYVRAPAADTEDTPGAAWALMFRVGAGRIGIP